MLYLADTPQKVDKIHRAICFAYSCISSIQFKSEVQLLRLRIAVKAIFFSSLLPKQLRFQSNIQPNRWSIAHIFRGIRANQEKLRNGKTSLMDNNKIC